MALKSRTCQECGDPFTPQQRDARFCCNDCRTAFHHRRRTRGAELYDLVMAHQLERNGSAGDLVKRLVDAYRTADTRLRAGRHSYLSLDAATLNLPIAYGDDGDRR